MEVNLIYRTIRGTRYFLCYDRNGADAEWIAEHMLEELKHRFGVLSWNTKELAEDRAKRFCIGAQVLTKNI